MRQCKLHVDEPEEGSRKDISYVYSGYAPLSVRLVQLAHRSDACNPFAEQGRNAPQWGALDEILPGGRSQSTTQKADRGAGSTLPADAAPMAGGKKKVTVVVFIGGVTYAEISALRCMNQQDAERQYIVATTKLISGGELIESLLERVDGLGVDRESWEEHMLQ